MTARGGQISTSRPGRRSVLGPGKWSRDGRGGEKPIAPHPAAASSSSLDIVMRCGRYFEAFIRASVVRFEVMTGLP